MENVRLFKILSGRIGFILFLNARVELVSSELPKAIKKIDSNSPKYTPVFFL
jgi:hypothetical protein